MVMNLIQRGISGINAFRTSNNPLVSATRSVSSQLLQTQAPNVVSMYNTVNSFLNSAIGGSATVSASSPQGVMGNHLTQGTTPAVNDLITRMSHINWARGYQWDVYLSPAPEGDFSPNAFGLPVFDLKETCAAVGDSYNLNAANTDYQFPLRKKLFDIQLTMFDNEKCDMEQYFEHWIHIVYPWEDTEDGLRGGYVQWLSESVRTLTVRKLDSMKRIIFERRYLVYPEIQLSGINNSESAIRTLTVPLVVVGYLGKSNPTGSGKNSPLDPLKDLAVDSIKGHMQGALYEKEVSAEILVDQGKEYVPF